jgi:hypothetical protein
MDEKVILETQEKISLNAILAQGKDPDNLGEPDGSTETQADFENATDGKISEAIAAFSDGGEK